MCDMYDGPSDLTLARIRSHQRNHCDPRDPDYMDDEDIAEFYGVDIDDLPDRNPPLRQEAEEECDIELPLVEPDHQYQKESA